MSKKFKQRKGFTLIELVIVVCIIGIIAAVLYGTLALPRIQKAKQKAKQLNTMRNIVRIYKAIEEHRIDNGYIPFHSGPFTKDSELHESICPFFIGPKEFSFKDEWGEYLRIYTAEDQVYSIYGIELLSYEDMVLIVSLGRDGERDTFYVKKNQDGKFEFEDSWNLEDDLIMLDGKWIQCSKFAKEKLE